MGIKARDATGCAEVTVLADRDYYNRDEVLACEGTGVVPVISKTETSANAKRGHFTVADFAYDTKRDRYTCPAGKHLTREPITRLDLVPERRALAIGDLWMPRRRCGVGFLDGGDRNIQESCFPHFSLDQSGVLITKRRTGEEHRWVTRKEG